MTKDESLEQAPAIPRSEDGELHPELIAAIGLLLLGDRNEHLGAFGAVAYVPVAEPEGQE